MNSNSIFWVVLAAGSFGGLLLKSQVATTANFLVALCALLSLTFVTAFACELCQKAKYARQAPLSALFVVGSVTALIGFCIGPG